MSNKQELFSSEQAGEMLGVTGRAVRKWIKSGRIKAILVAAGRHRSIHIDEIERIRAERRQQSAATAA